jgi:glycosyltransferase involved in cell wall biosynthesis
LNKNTVITPHWPEYPKGLRNKLIKLIIKIFDKTLGKLILKKAKLILAVSEPEIEWLKNKFKLNEDKIKLIPNGIPKDYLKQRNKLKFRNKYKIKVLNN